MTETDMYRWMLMALALAAPGVAHADPNKAAVVSGCGSPTYVSGTERSITQDTAGNGCVTAPLGTYADGSVTLSTSATQVFAANTRRYRIKLINTDLATASGGSGITIWCRWGTVAGAPASAHGVGSFLLPPGGGIDDQGPGVNQSAVNCIAESGTPVIYAEQY